MKATNQRDEGKSILRATRAIVVATLIGIASAPAEAATNRTAASQMPGAPVERGEAVYRDHCLACHGESLRGGEFAPALAGIEFRTKWAGRSAYDLFQYVQTRMPPAMPGKLSSTQYLDVLSYLLRDTQPADNGAAWPTDPSRLADMKLSGQAGGLPQTAIDVPPDPNPPANPLDAMRPVTSAMLAKPPIEDWLMWRRTYDSHGFSPLQHLSSDNVAGLQVVWAWSLPSGRTIVTPLVHDGVAFVYAAGDTIHALDAKSGRLLWRYTRASSGNTLRFSLRAIALCDDNVIVPTDDGHVVALNSKTGSVRWDKAIVDPTKMRFSGGPVIVDGNILLGTSTGSATLGHNFIVALDGNTGDELWRRYTVALPGEPGGDTWNDIDASLRTGAGVWTPGSYDPDTRLAFFGTGNNYFNAPLRKPARGASSNDALYTDSTLALDARDGKLIWHFQHLPNDRWNYDWAFERLTAELPIGGTKQKVVFAGGKLGIFDVMRAADGRYLSSVDMGLQTVIDSIDARTGAKHIVPGAIPEDGKTVSVCPSAHGARNWMPSAFNAPAAVLYIPFIDSCMKLRDPRPADATSAGVEVSSHPRPDSDGNFGGLQAIDMTTGKTLWTLRHRGVPTTGALATAGDLVFAGFLDRLFAAYDARTGKERWRARLNDVPSAAPISFMIDGRQYVAVITGHGPGFARNVDTFIAPEIINPQENNATLWVFALPDSK
jgi:alcohol dehydrogenase (cytochrome c)